MKRTLIYFIRYIVHAGVITTILTIFLVIFLLKLNITDQYPGDSLWKLWWQYYPKLITISVVIVGIYFVIQIVRIIRYTISIGARLFYIELAVWEFKIHQIPRSLYWNKKYFNQWLKQKINEREK